MKDTGVSMTYCEDEYDAGDEHEEDALYKTDADEPVPPEDVQQVGAEVEADEVIGENGHQKQSKPKTGEQTKVQVIMLYTIGYDSRRFHSETA